MDIGLGVRIPSIALGHSGDIEGYNFSNDWYKKCSYYHALTTMGKINDRGTHDYSQQTFMDKKFMLPFCMSQSINILDQPTGEKVQQSNIVGNSDRRVLYLKFKNELTHTLKVTCIYLQHRSLCVDNQRRVFKVSHHIASPSIYLHSLAP